MILFLPVFNLFSTGNQLGGELVTGVCQYGGVFAQGLVGLLHDLQLQYVVNGANEVDIIKKNEQHRYSNYWVKVYHKEVNCLRRNERGKEQRLTFAERKVSQIHGLHIVNMDSIVNLLALTLALTNTYCCLSSCSDL